MSGVVNKSVADRAVAVQADELVRKPFQPQELITRVKNLIGHGSSAAPQQISERPAAPASSLSSLFAPPSAQRGAPPATIPQSPAPMPPQTMEGLRPRAVDGFPHPTATLVPHAPAAPVAPPRTAATASEIQKLRVEVSRLELLVKKLQTELQIERQYNQALELHVRTLTQIE